MYHTQDHQITYKNDSTIQTKVKHFENECKKKIFCIIKVKWFIITGFIDQIYIKIF